MDRDAELDGSPASPGIAKPPHQSSGPCRAELTVRGSSDARNDRNGHDLAWRNGTALGAAVWDPPGHRSAGKDRWLSMPGFAVALRTRLKHGNALEAVLRRHRPPGQFWYLAQIGATDPGHGVGSALLGHRLDTIEGPAYLESSNAANIDLYERFGFRVTGEIALPFAGPKLWPMLRD